jgi:hypothetical protein
MARARVKAAGVMRGKPRACKVRKGSSSVKPRPAGRRAAKSR